MRVDIHLVSWNRPHMTNLVIQTLHRNTKRENFRLYVWDNGSDEETQDMLAGMLEDGLIDDLSMNVINIGLEGARQQLLNECKSEFFVCLDNDCLAPPMVGDRDWVDEMVDLMRYNEIYGAISMRTQVMIGTGNIFEKADADPELINLVDFPHPGGSYRIMRTALVKAIGGWGETRPGRGAEERYICGLLREAGFPTAFAAKIRCLHLFGLPDTDNWGYPKDWKPEDTGHSPDVWHPIFGSGDDMYEVEAYAGYKLMKGYFNGTLSRDTE